MRAIGETTTEWALEVVSILVSQRSEDNAGEIESDYDESESHDGHRKGGRSLLGTILVAGIQGEAKDWERKDHHRDGKSEDY